MGRSKKLQLWSVLFSGCLGLAGLGSRYLVPPDMIVPPAWSWGAVIAGVIGMLVFGTLWVRPHFAEHDSADLSFGRKGTMPFRDVVRRVALHTEWGLSYASREPSWPTWQDDLKAAIRGPLADGHVRSRGKHDIPGRGEATGRTDLSPHFWAYSDFQIEYLLVSNDASMAYQTGDAPVEVATDIVMDRADVDRVWSQVKGRKRRGRRSRFAELAQDWYAHKQEAFLNERLQYDVAWEEASRRGE